MGKSLKNMVFWGAIMVAVFVTIFVRPLSNLDEIWNFNIAKCIADGLVPYKDISMITTPFLSFITAGMIRIFGGSMFVTRVMSGILAVVILILVYRICIKLRINKIIAELLVLSFTMILLPFFALDYNFFSLALMLIVIILELSNAKKGISNKRNVFIGLFVGLSICTKQTIGLIILLTTIISSVIEIRSKKDIKKVLINLAFKSIGIVLPIIGLILYLLFTKSFGDFYSYCIAGISTFENKKTYKMFLNSNEIYIKLVGILVPVLLGITSIVSLIMTIRKNENKCLNIMVIYSLSSFIWIYPIVDEVHFWIAIIPSMITIFATALYYIYKNEHMINFNDKYINEFSEIMLLLIMVTAIIIMLYEQSDLIGNITKYRSINHFENIRVEPEVKHSIDEVDKFILSSEKRVYILDSRSALYMIPLNRYNKNFDMFNKGNFGRNGEDGIIENIKNDKAIYLILSDKYVKNWQNPNKVTDFVKNNFKLIGEIDKFEIYEN